MESLPQSAAGVQQPALEKRCVRCGIEKPEEEFHRNGSRRRSWCGACDCEGERARYWADIESSRARGRANYHLHAEDARKRRPIPPPPAPLPLPPEPLAIYTAGLFDGEGCIMCPPVTPGRLICQVTQSNRTCDAEALLRDLAEQWGIGRVYLQARATETRATLFVWKIYRSAHAVYFLKSMLPWLRFKREKALAAIEYSESIPARLY